MSRFGGSVRVLSREEEHALIARAKGGDPKAVDALIQHNEKFIHATARRAWKTYGGELEDFIQECVMGFWHAFKKFDPERGLRFISYAVHWMKASAHKYGMDKLAPIRVAKTQNLRIAMGRAGKVRHTLEADGSEATPDQMARALGLSLVEFERMMLGRRPMRSLDARQGQDSPRTFTEVIRDEAPSSEERLDQAQTSHRNKREVLRAVSRLDAKEREVIHSRLLCDREDRLTLKEVGERLGFSRERARQIEVRALGKLRKMLSAEPLLSLD